MIDILNEHYQQIEPFFFDIAKKVVSYTDETEDYGEANYLVKVCHDIVKNGCYNDKIIGLTENLYPAYNYHVLLKDNLHAFIDGNISGSEIIKKAGMDTWLDYNRNCPPTAFIASMVATALSEQKTGRVMEIGSGSGGTTIRAREWLSDNQMFVSTDVKSYFLNNWTPNTLLFDYDINREPQKMMYDLSPFDTIFGTNVLHVAKDIPYTLNRLKSMLKPDGRLIIGEGSPYAKNHRWILDILFSLFEGWWDIEPDSIRLEGGFLLKTQWLKYFEQAGLTIIETRSLETESKNYGNIFIMENG